MSELPLVQPGEIIASDHINLIAARTVQRYADVADRSALNPTPQTGDLSLLLDSLTTHFWDGTAWVWLGSGQDVVLNGNRVRLAGAADATGLDIDPSKTTAVRVRLGTGQSEFEVQGAADSVKFRVTDQSIASFGDGQVNIPSMTFLTDTSTGMHLAGAGNMQLGAGGVLSIAVRGARIDMPPVYNDTTGNAADMVVSAVGRIQRSTSARKYKSNIQPAPQLAALTLEPVTFHHDGGDADYIGFIADDMPIEEAIVRDDGEVENYDLRAVVAILAAKVNELTSRLEALEG